MHEAKDRPTERRPRTILMFIDGLGSGGAQRQFVRLACGLARRDHKVIVAVYNDLDHFAPQIVAAGIEIVRLNKPRRWSPRPIIGLEQLYRRVGAHAVIAFLRSPATKAELARLCNPSMRVIVAERSVYGETLPFWLRVSQQLHGLASFITVNSAFQLSRMAAEFPRLADRLVLIYNAVSLPREAASIRRSIKKSPKLLAISSLMEYKNSVLLAKAIGILRDEFGLRCEVSWLGETFEHLDGYGAFRETCATIDDLGLKEQWTWLGVRKDVDVEIAKHDALIHPSCIEGMSNAVCEAMAMGLPVIAGPISDHAELIERPGAGMLFESFDAHSIARTIARFVDLDHAARAKMSTVGRKIVQDQFAEEQLVTRYEMVLEAAIGSTELDALSGHRSCAA